MQKNKKDIDEIINYILSHYNLRYKFESYYHKLNEFKNLAEKVYGKSSINYVENQINKLYENIGNDILKSYKVYKSSSFLENEQDFLSQNIFSMKFKSRKIENEKTFIKYATNLYRISILAELDIEQMQKIFHNWKKRSGYNFNVGATLNTLSKKDYALFEKDEYLKALRTLGYNKQKYNNIKTNNFYKELKFRNFFTSALKNLMYENEKIDEEILEMKERDIKYIEK